MLVFSSLMSLGRSDEAVSLMLFVAALIVAGCWAYLTREHKTVFGKNFAVTFLGLAAVILAAFGTVLLV